MEDDIRFKLEEFANRFHEVWFRFQYDDNRRCYLISYMMPDDLDDDDTLWDEIASLKSYFRDSYGDNAPLFSQGETVFRLSDDAVGINMSGSQSFVASPAKNYIFCFDNSDDCFVDGYEDYQLAA